MLIVFNQMISLFLLMLTGYLANRFGVIDKTFESKVSRFIVNISLPATILNAVTGIVSIRSLIICAPMMR